MYKFGKDSSDNSTMLEHQKIHTGTKECIHEGNPIIVINVENLSGIHPLLNIRKLMVEINLVGVMKAFTKSSILIRHQRIHTRQKPYHCKKCGKVFSYSSSLVEYQRIHECNLCRKTFPHSLAFRFDSQSRYMPRLQIHP
ncbi:hypothetical protein QTO34_018783, partial [Cnephaeus nilssonii]